MPKYRTFLARIFPYSIQMRENTDQKKIRIWALFAQRKDLFDHIIGLLISDIGEVINYKYDKDFISNNKVKLYLMENFNDDIQFYPSEGCVESMFLFSSTLSIEAVLKKLRSMNVLKEAAETICQALTNIDINLYDKFGDPHELKYLWEKLRFWIVLFLFALPYLKFLSCKVLSTKTFQVFMTRMIII